MAREPRYLHDPILKDLLEKMVFLGGPRQVGKTTFACDLLVPPKKLQYYNWDKLTQRKVALRGQWIPDVPYVILDEFHKHSKWKTWIKGEFDTQKNRYHFLLTGSARLDLYRRGGDSLQGRYHYYRLHPFSLAEILKRGFQGEPGREIRPLRDYLPSFHDDLMTLFHYGGFPEPFLKQSPTHLRRWHTERFERLLREDIRDLTQIRDLGTLTLLSDLLPQKVGSILSINSLAEDLQVNFRTISNWLDVFERFYYSFRLAPYASKKIASVRKEKKLYLWDWSLIPNPGARWENLVASHLLKFAHFLHDSAGWNIELYYLRDSTGREVDFLLCIDHRPWMAVEVKTDSRSLSKHLFYLRERLKIPYCYQVTADRDTHYQKDGITAISAARFLSALV